MRNLHETALKNLRFWGLLIFLIVFQNSEVSSQNSKSKLESDYAAPMSICWTYYGDIKSDLGVASDNVNELFFSTFQGKIISINSFDASKRWETDLGGEILSAPVIDAANVYILVSNFDNKVKRTDEDLRERKEFVLRSLDKLTGLTVWESSLPDAFDSTDINDNTIYVYNYGSYLIIVTVSGNIYSVDKLNGRIRWNKRLNLKVSSVPFFENDEILLGVVDKRVLLLSAVTGAILEDFKTSNSPTVVFKAKDVKSDDILFWGDKKGSVTSLNIRNRKLIWNTRKGGEISEIVLTEKGLLVTSFDNFIYLISYKEGDLIWKRRMEGRVSSASLIGNDFIVVTVNSEPTATIIKLENGKTVNKLILESGAYFTGNYMKIGETLIYSTSRGISSFSLNGQCPV